MDRRDFLKVMGLIAAAGGLPVLVTYNHENKLQRFVRGALEPKDLINGVIGRCEGFRFITSSPLMPPPEPPRARQKMDAFIHRKLGHYGF